MSHFGHVNEVNINISKPMQAAFKINIREIAIFVGYNGVGKTFVLINTYCIATVANAIVYGVRDQALKEVAQFTYDKCFDEQDITGSIEMDFSSGAIVGVIFDNGRVTSVEFSGFDEVTEGTTPIYMSTNLRLFTNMSTYLKFRKIHSDNGLNEMQMMEKMLELYKLYDLTYAEGLIKRCPITVTDEHRKSLEKYDITDNIELFNVDLEKGEFYIMIDGVRKDLSRYGNGHQALFNMFFGARP